MNNSGHVIILGNGANALGALRSLSDKNVTLHLVATNKNDPVMFSKYAKQKKVIKEKDIEDNRKFRNFLINSFHENCVLIPTSDVFVKKLNDNRVELKKYFKFILPSKNIIDILLDKYKEVEKIKSLNIPVPKTIKLDENYVKIIEKYDFPVIVKPRTTKAYEKLNKKNVLIKSKEHFDLFLNEKNKIISDLIVQEFIRGPDTNQWVCNCFFDENGKLKQALIFNRLSLYPPHRGVTSYAISKKNDIIFEYAKEIGSKLNYIGPAMIEFKFDNNDMKYKYIEINPRLGQCNFFDTNCGINNVYYTYLVSCGIQLPKKIPIQKNNVICISLIYDLIGKIQDRENPIKIIKTYFENISKKHVGQIFYWKDVKPAIFHILLLIRKLLKK